MGGGGLLDARPAAAQAPREQSSESVTAPEAFSPSARAYPPGIDDARDLRRQRAARYLAIAVFSGTSALSFWAGIDYFVNGDACVETVGDGLCITRRERSDSERNWAIAGLVLGTAYLTTAIGLTIGTLRMEKRVRDARRSAQALRPDLAVHPRGARLQLTFSF